MNTSESPDFGVRLMALAEIFDVKLSPQRAALYFDALRDLPFAVVADALNTAAKTCTFFPKPAEIRALAVGDAEDAAESAWVAMKQAMSRLGHMASVSIDDAALAETIVAVFGCWSAACSVDLSPEMWAAKRKEFGRVYRVMRQRNLSGGRYLIGQAEQNNGRNPEWLRFVTVGRISDGAVRLLPWSEAERERERLAVEANTLSRVDAGSLMRQIEARALGESA